MTRRELLAFAALAPAVLFSAIAVVYVKYLTRVEFVRVQEMRAARDALDIEWGRLRLEEASLVTYNRIEDTARRALDMHLPQGGEVRVLEVPAHGQR